MSLSSLITTSDQNHFYRLTNEAIINYAFDHINLVNTKTNKIISFNFWPGTKNAQCFILDSTHVMYRYNGHPMTILFYVTNGTIWVIESKSTREKSDSTTRPDVYTNGYLHISHYESKTFDILWTHKTEYEYTDRCPLTMYPHMYICPGFTILNTFCKKYMFIQIKSTFSHIRFRIVVLNMETYDIKILDESWKCIPNVSNSTMVTMLYNDFEKNLVIYDLINGTEKTYDSIETIAPIQNLETDTLDIITKNTKGDTNIINLSSGQHKLNNFESTDKFEICIRDESIEVMLYRQFDVYKGIVTLSQNTDDTMIKTIDKMYEIIDDAIHKRNSYVAMCYKIYDNDVFVHIYIDFNYFKEEIEIRLSNKYQRKEDVIYNKIEYLMKEVNKIECLIKADKQNEKLLLETSNQYL
jgi:hypothetical protein